MNNLTIRFGSIGLLLWVGFGIFYHLVTGDGPFSWSDPWLYIDIAFAPFFTLFWTVVILALGVTAFYAIVKIHARHEIRQKEEALEKERQANRDRQAANREKWEKRYPKTTLPHLRK